MAKSKLGQNFLRDTAGIDRIVGALGDVSRATVVEIGPGGGAITERLAGLARRLIAVEVDGGLAGALEHRFDKLIGDGRLCIERQDVLSFDFHRAAAVAGEKLVVVGNLPYYITSPILTRLAQAGTVIELAVLMVQREVADRVTAKPGSREYGLLSVMTQMHGSVTSLFTLPPEAFSPPPEVHSTVLRWHFEPRFEGLGVGLETLEPLLKAAFAQKRKTLGNNLRAAGYAPEAIQLGCASAGVSPQARAETLSLEEFAALARNLKRE